MKKVIVLKGLPASGKSTFAKSLGYKRINKDDLRAMIDDGKWSRGNEKLIVFLRNMLLKYLMQEGQDIVIDDTNLNPKNKKQIQAQIMLNNSFGEHQYELEEKFIDTPLEECIKRDSKRDRPVGKKVIMEMWSRYLKPEPVKGDPNLPRCILVDIDGTIAQCGDRDIYDGSKVYLDTVIEPVADIVRRYLNEFSFGDKVIYLSGRDEKYRDVTEQWLKNNGLWSGTLYMRPEDDKRCDTIIKKELYEAHIKGKYNVLFVIDDRKRIKRLWSQEGIFILDVNQFDLEY